MGYTSQQFIQKANTIHNNKYNYSKINYQNIKTKIEIICPKHGNFWQLPYDHLRGKGCPKCGRESLKKQKQNNDKKINFEILTKDIKNRDTIIEIKCPNCNQIFKKTYWNFQRSKNCPLCNPKKARQRKTTEEFIKEAKEVHGNKYDYSLVDYKNNNTKVKIICPVHGVFEQIPKEHLRGRNCSKCSGGVKDTKESFVQKAKLIHGENAYDYSLVNYINSNTKIKIKCLECGNELVVLPNSFLQGRGCSHGRKSFGEKIIKQFLIENNINYIQEAVFVDLIGINGGKLRFDFWLPDLNTVIEFQGKQHYEIRESWDGKSDTNLNIRQLNDQIKRDYCRNNNIKEIEIPYTDLRNIYKILTEHFS